MHARVRVARVRERRCSCVTLREASNGQSSRSLPSCQLAVILWKVWFAVLILLNAIQQFPYAQQGRDKLIKEIENQFGSQTVILNNIARLFFFSPSVARSCFLSVTKPRSPSSWEEREGFFMLSVAHMGERGRGNAGPGGWMLFRLFHPFYTPFPRRQRDKRSVWKQQFRPCE